ncbi:hypothetical protein [Delftia acidovorans]|uniref:hypothetical protein n=2 Tax=Delftia acidovorans TaxID=80866 RepID=UPI001D0C9562|nr:hypothetical protein [Delftia acidovorans]
MMAAIETLKQIAALDRQGLTALDESMLDLLATLPALVPDILKTLDLASDAQASLENVLCHLGNRMTAADLRARDLVATELLQSLQVLSGQPGSRLH